MGAGALIKIKNQSQEHLKISYSNINCVHQNGDQGSDFAPISGTVMPNQSLPASGEQYIEAEASGLCAFKTSTFTINFQGNNGTLFAKFDESNRTWRVDRNKIIGVRLYVYTQVIEIGDCYNINIVILNEWFTPNWMKEVEDSKYLNEINIPGTHDTCTYNISFLKDAASFHFAVCQKTSLQDQLEKGIRCIDIRCRHENNNFSLHHELIFLGMIFDDVLKIIQDFLKNHHTETVIMFVKNEYKQINCSRSFEDTFDDYVQRYSGLFYLNDNVPTLGSVRGKIVLLRRFPLSNQGSKLGINLYENWGDNKTFAVNSGSVEFKVQDNYEVDWLFGSRLKLKAIKDLLDEAKNNSSNKNWYVNFTSGNRPVLITPEKLATKVNVDGMNGCFYEYLKTHTGFVGTIMMDFPFYKGNEIVNGIIERNFCDFTL